MALHSFNLSVSSCWDYTCLPGFVRSENIMPVVSSMAQVLRTAALQWYHCKRNQHYHIHITFISDLVLLGNVFIVSGNSFRQSALVLLVKYKSCFADAFRAQIIQTFNFMYPCTIKWLSLKLIPALKACGLFWMTWEQLVTGQGFSAVSLYSSVRACWQAEWGHRHAFLHIRERESRVAFKSSRSSKIKTASGVVTTADLWCTQEEEKVQGNWKSIENQHQRHFLFFSFLFLSFLLFKALAFVYLKKFSSC